MPLGGATKKLQRLADTAEDLYHRINDLRDQVAEMRETVQSTEASVDRLERELDAQRAVLEALARDRGVDVDAVLAEASIGEAEPSGGGDGEETAGGNDRGETESG